MKRRIDFTEGSILRQLIVFILPLIATTALQQLFNTADMIIVRWFVSDTAYAAVGSTGTIVGVCGLRLLWIFSIFPHRPTVTVLFMIYPITWLIASMANLIYYFFIQHRITNLKAQGAAL